jgi:8-oxo-dGTP pyrophosphatase MutT (NUDIX family)
MARICVGALIVERVDRPRVLLGRRSATRVFLPDVWDVPGGHCEPGEPLERVLFRELREEIGIVPTAWRPFDDLIGQVAGDDEPVVLHLYEVTAWTGVPRNLRPEEHAELAWFTVDAACALALACDAYPRLFRRLASTA